jgi:hypothetical protein
MTPLIVIALKLGGSLLAVLALGWLAGFMGLGGETRIRDEAHAMQLADEGLYGFEATDAVRDLAGYSALVKETIATRWWWSKARTS